MNTLNEKAQEGFLTMNQKMSNSGASLPPQQVEPKILESAEESYFSSGDEIPASAVCVSPASRTQEIIRGNRSQGSFSIQFASMSSATFTVKKAYLYNFGCEGKDREVHEQPILQNFQVQNHRTLISFNDSPFEVSSDTLIAVLVDNPKNFRVSFKAGEFKYSSGDIPDPNAPAKILLRDALASYSSLGSMQGIIHLQQLYVVASLSVPNGGLRLTPDPSECMKWRGVSGNDSTGSVVLEKHQIVQAYNNFVDECGDDTVKEYLQKVEEQIVDSLWQDSPLPNDVEQGLRAACNNTVFRSDRQPNPPSTHRSAVIDAVVSSVFLILSIAGFSESLKTKIRSSFKQSLEEDLVDKLPRFTKMFKAIVSPNSSAAKRRFEFGQMVEKMLDFGLFSVVTGAIWDKVSVLEALYFSCTGMVQIEFWCSSDRPMLLGQLALNDDAFNHSIQFIRSAVEACGKEASGATKKGKKKNDANEVCVEDGPTGAKEKENVCGTEATSGGKKPKNKKNGVKNGEQATPVGKKTKKKNSVKNGAQATSGGNKAKKKKRGGNKKRKKGGNVGAEEAISGGKKKKVRGSS